MISQQIRQNILDLLQKCEFRKLCDTYFADDFLWIIKGSSILSGEHHDKDEFFTNVIGRLNNVLLPDWKMHILDSYVDNDTLIVEMRGEIKAKNGEDYNNEYCWIFKFINDKITSITAYYDSLLVNKTLIANEK
jgi:ketosteroid isomerase-like protein